jgi:hypothetical protein
MWESIPRRLVKSTLPSSSSNGGGVSHTDFMGFFLAVFQQRRGLLYVTIQTVRTEMKKGGGKSSAEKTNQLAQLTEAVKRTETILRQAGVAFDDVKSI